jgi:hypothetical protein
MPLNAPPGMEPAPKNAPTVASGTSEWDQAELAKLHDKYPETIRVAAFQAIVAGLPEDLTHNDIGARDAQSVARFLLTIKTKKEVDAILPKVAPLARSRNMLLALADRVDQSDADQKASEAIIGALVKQPLQPGKDDTWALRCRKLLLVEVIALPGKRKNAATETAEIMRNLYKEQGILLGMPEASFKDLTRTAQVMERVINHLADELAKQSLTREAKDSIDQARRDLLVAQFIAANDLDRTVLLQRVWIHLLSVHLAQQCPQRAKEMRQVQQQFSATTGEAANVFVQLRGGEEKILALWMLANDLK